MRTQSRLTARLFDRLIPALATVRERAIEYEKAFAEELDLIEPDYRDSARNLLHYLSVRQNDLRHLQDDLSSLGLSSLGRLEAHTLASLDTVLSTLHRLADRLLPAGNDIEAPVSFRMGPLLLGDHASRLMGPQPVSRSVRIMVTMPSEAATEPDLVRRLLQAGMDVMRINCAHDDGEAWTAMVRNLRLAEREVGRRCRVLADLAGPKLRTGPLDSMDRVVKIRPQRDLRGGVLAPARVWLTPLEAPQPMPAEANAVITFAGTLLSEAGPGDVIEVDDCRGKHRALEVTLTERNSCLAEADKTLYFDEGAGLRLSGDHGRAGEGRVAGLPAAVTPIVLFRGDTLLLTRGDEPGRPALRDENNRMLEPARIPCSLDAAFDQVRQGEQVWFDDGKIGGVIVGSDGARIEVRITHAAPRGSKLRPDKGINLPDTELQVPALTPKDLEDLKSMAKHVDMVGLSFVRSPEDVYLLEDRMHELGAGHLGIVLKIENRMAFERLPRLLLASLRSPPVGVMVARGDLAVEVGFERLSEVQEEILWLCEAAHVPVIWATQVLESMAKSGAPSRAEVTDAAMSGRAECVMLNKGPYIVDAVEFLSDVLERVVSHQSKKTAMLRRLSVSQVS